MNSYIKDRQIKPSQNRSQFRCKQLLHIPSFYLSICVAKFNGNVSFKLILESDSLKYEIVLTQLQTMIHYKALKL